MTETTRAQINDFLGQKRLAVVGVSRNAQDFSRTLFAELSKRGYDVVPVNPQASEVDGRQCYAHVQDIQPPVAGVLVMTSPHATDQVVRDCAEAGVTRVWMHRGEGIGSVSQPALDFCRANQISVVAGFCPFMFLPGTPFFHRMHGFVKRLSGSYPS